jgi:flagellar protein FlbD
LIYLTRLNGQILMLNSDVIEYIEETPDTVICLTNGKKIMVRESMELIGDKVVEFKKRIYTNIKNN